MAEPSTAGVDKPRSSPGNQVPYVVQVKNQIRSIRFKFMRYRRHPVFRRRVVEREERGQGAHAPRSPSEANARRQKASGGCEPPVPSPCRLSVMSIYPFLAIND